VGLRNTWFTKRLVAVSWSTRCPVTYPRSTRSFVNRLFCVSHFPARSYCTPDDDRGAGDAVDTLNGCCRRRQHRERVQGYPTCGNGRFRLETVLLCILRENGQEHSGDIYPMHPRVVILRVRLPSVHQRLGWHRVNGS